MCMAVERLILCRQCGLLEGTYGFYEEALCHLLGRIMRFFRLLRPLKLGLTPHTIHKCNHCSCRDWYCNGFGWQCWPTAVPCSSHMYNTAVC